MKYSLGILLQAEGIYLPVPLQKHEGRIFKFFQQRSASTKITIASEIQIHYDCFQKSHMKVSISGTFSYIVLGLSKG